MSNLEETIRTHVSLGSQAPSGWFPVRCLVCEDHPNKKRGGFRFDGGKVAYHCFNCPAAAVYDSMHGGLSDKMRDILLKFGVAEEDLNRIVLGDLEDGQDKKPTKKQQKKVQSDLAPTEIGLPDHFYRLIEDCKNPVAQDLITQLRALEHIEDRGMSQQDYPFFLSRFETKDWEKKSWNYRLIIPVYYQDKLIFYQGRDLEPEQKRIKYKSTSASKTKVMYGYEEIFRKTNDPLYVVEGFFDAFHIKGVAVFGNEFTEDQIKILNRCPRPKVVIPDRKGDGHLLAQQAVKHNWQVSIPEIGGCKDVNAAVVKYGTLYVMQSIVENTMSGFEALASVEMYCEKSKPTRKKETV